MQITEYILQPFLLLFLTITLALFTFNALWLFGSFTVILYIVIRYNQQEPGEYQLEIKRTIKGKRFKESDLIRVYILVRNTGDGVFRGEIADILPNNTRIWEGSNIFLVKLLPGEEVELSYVVSISTRGQYIFGPIRTRYHSTNEYFQEVIDHEIFREVLIIPLPDRVTKYQLPPAFLTMLGGPFKSKLVGDGMNFAGIREYQIGDTFRRINWKQTARYHTLYSNEFEINRASNILLVLDLTEDEEDISDASVRAALGLANYLMNFRCKIGFVTIGEYVTYIPLKSGRRHLIEITEHLTKIRSISKIHNLELFKIRLRDGLKRIKSEKNEILLFSSMMNLDKATYMSSLLINKGNLTILSPSANPLLDTSDPIYAFSKRVMDLRNAVLSNYMLQKQIRIYEWIPGVPFDVSVSQWRAKK